MYLILTIDAKKTVFFCKKSPNYFHTQNILEIQTKSKIFYKLWNMDILHNLSVTGHKLHDKIIIYS